MEKVKLSYVRGLRDVLEIPTKEERRDYIGRQNNRLVKGLLTSYGIPFIILGAAALIEKLSVYSITSQDELGMVFGGAIDYFVETVFNYPTLAECYKTTAFDGINRLGG